MRFTWFNLMPWRYLPDDEEMVARMYEHGKAVSYATYFEIDDVIDPAESRKWIMTALRSVPPPPARSGKKRPCVDAW